MYQCSHVRGWAALWLYQLVTASTCGDVCQPLCPTYHSAATGWHMHTSSCVCYVLVPTLYRVDITVHMSAVCQGHYVAAWHLLLLCPTALIWWHGHAWCGLVQALGMTCKPVPHTPAVSQLHRVTWATLFPCLPCPSATMGRLDTPVHSYKTSQLCQASVWASLCAHRLHPSTDRWH